MVRNKPAFYDLLNVRASAQRHLVEAGNGVIFATRRAGEDAQDELGFGIDDVAKLIISLSEDEFHATHEYANSPSPMDAYLAKRADSRGVIKRIYVKFKMTADYRIVAVCSCHRARH